MGCATPFRHKERRGGNPGVESAASAENLWQILVSAIEVPTQGKKAQS
jgi:hypothetical protein